MLFRTGVAGRFISVLLFRTKPFSPSPETPLIAVVIVFAMYPHFAVCVMQVPKKNTIVLIDCSSVIGR